jgi:hypothetical protein
MRQVSAASPRFDMKSFDLAALDTLPLCLSRDSQQTPPAAPGSYPRDQTCACPLA